MFGWRFKVVPLIFCQAGNFGMNEFKLPISGLQSEESFASGTKATTLTLSEPRCHFLAQSIL